MYCVLEIGIWMKRNMLKLNDNKTEFTVFKSKSNVETFAEECIQVGCTALEITPKVKYLYLTSLV